MTNKKLKRQSFLEAAKRLKEKKRLVSDKNSAGAAYEIGEISWNKYIKRAARNEKVYNLKKTWQL